jgi:predicted RNA-binding Zn ribbon-like protein
LKERILSIADLHAWQAEMDLPNARWDGSLKELRDFRESLRMAILGRRGSGIYFALEERDAGPSLPTVSWIRKQPLGTLIAMSALSVIADAREFDRVKLCPGNHCGWMFLDETKNGRRKWCLMEVCGNRAKANRHYARSLKDDPVP